jgi:hypothetical protein
LKAKIIKIKDYSDCQLLLQQTNTIPFLSKISNIGTLSIMISVKTILQDNFSSTTRLTAISTDILHTPKKIAIREKQQIVQKHKNWMKR